MVQGPFAKRVSVATSAANRRRSTRLQLTIPIILSGRDTARQSFREETKTKPQ